MLPTRVVTLKTGKATEFNKNGAKVLKRVMRNLQTVCISFYKLTKVILGPVNSDTGEVTMGNNGREVKQIFFVGLH